VVVASNSEISHLQKLTHGMLKMVKTHLDIVAIREISLFRIVINYASSLEIDLEVRVSEINPFWVIEV
jgi:hypothetical protein